MIKSALSRLFAVILGSTSISACEGQAPQTDIPEDALSVRLAVIDKVIEKEAPFRFQYIIKNGTADAIRILPWATPLEKILSADSFDITFNGEQLPYIGRMVKRMAPTDADYVTISAGESVEVTVDLSNAYDTSASGNYRVQLRTYRGVYSIETTAFVIGSEPLMIDRR